MNDSATAPTHLPVTVVYKNASTHLAGGAKQPFKQGGRAPAAITGELCYLAASKVYLQIFQVEFVCAVTRVWGPPG